jgi:hypothetical protein
MTRSIKDKLPDQRCVELSRIYAGNAKKLFGNGRIHGDGRFCRPAMAAHPIAERFDQGWQRSSLGLLCKRHDASALQILDKPIGPSHVATISAAKRMRARAPRQMTRKAGEHGLIQLIYPNLFD